MIPNQNFKLKRLSLWLSFFRAVASQLDCNFLKVVSSAIVDKYIGESARMIREMFNYARDHQPCIVFMDEIDAIGLLFKFFKVLKFVRFRWATFL